MDAKYFVCVRAGFVVGFGCKCVLSKNNFTRCEVVMVNIIAHVNICDIYKGELFSLVWQHQLFIS